MCGNIRICSSSPSSHRSNSKNPPKNVAAAAEKEESNVDGDDDEAHIIIPRQNKGVCTACDVAVWTVLGCPNLEIKWCKGCKNFRPWPAFGEKVSATKCMRCRERQKEKYASQKDLYRKNLDKNGAYDGLDKKDDDDAVAADGLRNLMHAR